MTAAPSIRYRTLPLALAGLISCLAPAAASADASGDKSELPPVSAVPSANAAVGDGAVLPPPEIALIVQPADPKRLALARVGAWVGAAGGIALTVWGLSGMASAVTSDADPGALHGGAALVISGSVLAALCSTIIGILQGEGPSAAPR